MPTKFFKQQAEKKPVTRSIETHRHKVALLKPQVAPVKVPYMDYFITLASNTPLPIRVYRPDIEPPSSYPTVFYIPGSAFIARAPQFAYFICSLLAKVSRCQVILISHRLAPEHKFPAGLDDVYHLIKFFITVPVSFSKINHDKIAISGYSSRGNLATLVTLRVIKEKLPIYAQFLFSPLLDLSRSLCDYQEYEEKDTIIKKDFVEWFIELYKPNHVSLHDPKISPYWHNSKTLSPLPFTDITWGKHDRFYSDCEAFSQKLLFAGVNLRKTIIKNSNHAFWWHKPNVVEIVGKKLSLIFGNQPVPRPISIKSHYVKQTINKMKALSSQIEPKTKAPDIASYRLR
jgi:acetyl esterase/lipase